MSVWGACEAYAWWDGGKEWEPCDAGEVATDGPGLKPHMALSDSQQTCGADQKSTPTSV